MVSTEVLGLYPVELFGLLHYFLYVVDSLGLKIRTLHWIEFGKLHLRDLAPSEDVYLILIAISCLSSEVGYCRLQHGFCFAS